MNRFTTIIACALVLTALSGCSKEKYSGQDDAKMHFVPSLPGTKASDTAFEAGDSFGIYVVEYDNLVPAPLQLSGNWANNAEASFDGSVWKRMDPTFASSGQRSPEIMRFIENNGNYTVKYLY